MFCKTIEFQYSFSISASFPYIAALSKNQKDIYTKKFTRKKIKNPDHEEIKRYIELKFRSLTSMHQFNPKGSVLVVITVFRKTNSSDAHNFAEGICDALEKAIGINDRQFHVYTIPMIDKERPRITVEIFQ